METTRAVLRQAVLGAALAVVTACGAASPTTPGGQPVQSASLQFTHLPVPYSPLRSNFSATQGGYFTVGGTPIRPYLSFSSGGPSPVDVDVYAPAAGAVTGVSQNEGSDGARLDVLAAGGHRYYLSGNVTFVVSPGTAVAAGQVVGRRAVEFRQGASRVNLGVIHPTRRLGFVSPDRYPEELLNAVSPLDYYTPSTRDLIVGALEAGPASLDLNFDTPGRLQGFWYLPSIPRAQSTSPAHSAGWLWFHKTITAQRLGLSGFSIVASSPQGQSTNYDLGADAGPAFVDVSPASGVVTYRFPYSSTNAIVLRVEMLSDSSVRAETFDTHNGLPPGFTANAKTYIR